MTILKNREIVIKLMVNFFTLELVVLCGVKVLVNLFKVRVAGKLNFHSYISVLSGVKTSAKLFRAKVIC